VHIGISTSVIQSGQTGVSQYVFALLRALIEQAEHEYTLFVLENDLRLFDFATGKVNLIEVREAFRPPIKDIGWHQTVLPRLATQHKLDVLHIPSYRRMLWTSPCPLVATIHDLAPFHVRGKYSWPRMFYARTIVPWLARRQAQIIAVSENTARDAETFLNVSSERLSVIYNGMDHSRFFSGDAAHARSLAATRFGLKRPFFLYVARLEHPGKNHNRLIEAFNRFKAAGKSEWQLVLAGSDWHGADLIHSAIRKSPYSEEIRCLGFVPDDFLPELYRAAGVFVYPSLFEGFGMPPTEAMACGCPVISSARGSLGEIIGGAAIRVDPEDIDGLAGWLHVLSTSESDRDRLRVAGLEQAGRFDWTITAAATARVYERAAIGASTTTRRRLMSHGLAHPSETNR
jgi:glycosyltransferase involved in cell wall biosynthesis